MAMVMSMIVVCVVIRQLVEASLTENACAMVTFSMGKYFDE